MDERIDALLGEATEKILNCNPRTIPAQGLFGGKLGLLSYSLSLYKAEQDEAYLRLIEVVLEDLFDPIHGRDEAFFADSSLVNGLPGLGIILHELVQEGLLDEAYQRQIDTLSDLAFENASQLLSDSNFDYFYGSIGLLFYLNEVGATQYCKRLVEALDRHARAHDALFYSQFGDSSMQGINFGFAHGSLSIVAVLLEIYRKTPSRGTAELMLNTMEALLQFMRGAIDPRAIHYEEDGRAQKPKPACFFPYNITTQREDHRVIPGSDQNRYHANRRLGWCNSDLGYVLKLYQLSEIGHRAKYLRTADTIGREVAARKSPEDTAITEAYLCHGSAGVALLFGKLFETSRKPLYQTAYTHWIGVTLDFMETELKKPFRIENLQLLMGWLGPLLVLHHHRDKAVTGWEKLFLV